MIRFRIRVSRWYLLVLGLLSIPYAMIVAAGSLWLYQKGWLWHFMLASTVLTGAGWQILAWLKRRNAEAAADQVQPGEHWTAAGRRAWDAVDQLARRLEDQELPLDRPELLWQVLEEILQTVASQFHPEARRAVLETPMPHVLRIGELVLRDFRQAFSEHVPGAHILTLNDWEQLRRLAALWRPVYLLYRIVTLGLNPVNSLLREVRDAASGKLVDASTGQIRRWAVGFCVRKAGYYAIQLYSGHLVLDEIEFREGQTRSSHRDILQASQRQERLAEEPLRILVLGQVKSGKSSLINALFGETRAAVDVVPRTRGVEAHLLDRDGSPRAILLDTAGYEGADAGEDGFARWREMIHDCDLVLLVISARSAARRADRQLLDALRDLYRRQADRQMPPLVVVLTHVDQLRPWGQWNPPYDVNRPADEKGAQIREAVQAVRDDLGLEAEAVVPVCLRPEQLYNVAEALSPEILRVMPEALRVKCVRCLRQFHKEQYWQRLWEQAANSGRLLLKAGAAWLNGVGR